MHLAVRAVGAVAVVAVLLLLPAASGQSTASVRVTVNGSPTIPLGNSTTVGISVTLEMQNVVCTAAPATATVNVAVTSPMVVAGISGPSAAVPVVFPLQAPGAYGQLSPYSGTMPANVTITVDRTAPPNHQHTFNVTASIAKENLSNCQVADAAGPFAASQTASLTITTGAGTGPGGNTTTGPRPGGTTAPAEESVALPFGIQAALVVGLAVLGARRRR
jgi:hypothetical protein